MECTEEMVKSGSSEDYLKCILALKKKNDMVKVC